MNPKNNVKINPAALKTLQQLDDVAHGINTTGTFALLVLHMNGDNVAKVPMTQLINSDVQKARIAGVRLDTNQSIQSMVDRTLTILEKHRIIKAENLPLGNGEVCYQINPKLAQL